MRYNLNRVKDLLRESHPEIGELGFYMERPYDMIEVLGDEDITIVHPMRFGINVLGRPELTIEQIERFMDTLKYMGFDSYYWDYDKWGMLFFEFVLNDGDEIYYEVSDVIGARR